MTHASVSIQITPESAPSLPSWFAEVAAFAHRLTHVGILQAIGEQVRFARARFGQYELLDFVVVLIGYAVSGEPTRLSFYERLLPFAEPFMALFGRKQLPHRSTLSRFLAALDQPTVEALRALFLKDLAARTPFDSAGGLWDRVGKQWLVVDVDGTRQAARQRALPQMESLPLPHRRFDQTCAPGYLGRKRGEVVRTRTVILQAHTHQFLGSFGEAGNGDYRGELLRAIEVISSYASQLALPTAFVLLRLDGLYGDAGSAHRCAGGWPWDDCPQSRLQLAWSGGGQAGSCASTGSSEHPSRKRDDPCALRLPSSPLDAERPRCTSSGG